MSRPRLVSRLLYLADRFGRRRDAALAVPETRDVEPPADDPPPAERPQGTLVWMHAPDAAAAAPLPALVHELSRLRGEPVHGLLTYSRGVVPEQLRGAVDIARAPSDIGSQVQAFLDFWKPQAGLVLGLPDRPALLGAARARGIPLLMAAPDRDIARGRQRLPMLAASLLGNFDILFAPSGAAARVLRRHVVDRARVVTTGPLTDTAVADPADQRELTRLAALLSGRPVWMAYGPTAEEIPAIARAHRHAARAAHRLLLIVAGADAEVAQTLGNRMTREGWRVARAADGEDAEPDTQVFLADTSEETDLWFRLAPIVFAGGSLAGESPPADPFRAATHGAALIAGPRGTGARYRRLDADRAIERIAEPDGLGPAVAALLAPDRAATLALAGWSVVSESAHVIDTIARRIDEAMDMVEAGT